MRACLRQRPDGLSGGVGLRAESAAEGQRGQVVAAGAGQVGPADHVQRPQHQHAVAHPEDGVIDGADAGQAALHRRQHVEGRALPRRRHARIGGEDARRQRRLPFGPRALERLLGRLPRERPPARHRAAEQPVLEAVLGHHVEPLDAARGEVQFRVEQSRGPVNQRLAGPVQHPHAQAAVGRQAAVRLLHRPDPPAGRADLPDRDGHRRPARLLRRQLHREEVAALRALAAALHQPRPHPHRPGRPRARQHRRQAVRPLAEAPLHLRLVEQLGGVSRLPHRHPHAHAAGPDAGREEVARLDGRLVAGVGERVAKEDVAAPAVGRAAGEVEELFRRHGASAFRRSLRAR